MDTNATTKLRKTCSFSISTSSSSAVESDADADGVHSGRVDCLGAGGGGECSGDVKVGGGTDAIDCCRTDGGGEAGWDPEACLRHSSSCLTIEGRSATVCNTHPTLHKMRIMRTG